MIDITNEVLTRIENDVTESLVVTSYPNISETYPLIVLTEIDNSTNPDTIDSSGENHAILAFEVSIFTNGEKRMSNARVIRDKVDAIMSGIYGMNRDFANSVPNYADSSIYRYLLRYSCTVDKNNKIYRR